RCASETEISSVSSLDNDAAIKHVCEVAKQLEFDYDYIGEDEIKRFNTITNSVFVGVEPIAIYDYYCFIMNDKIDIRINSVTREFSFYIDDELVYEFVC
ncbi:MAG: hypothetical protein K2J41_05315, partial [Eubacterium sp.]|nr:hypothetical protein [Eubacterium sp.]